jgi:hypothetical protein
MSQCIAGEARDNELHTDPAMEPVDRALRLEGLASKL